MASRTKVLITGSSGMLGTSLAKELFKDYSIIGLDVKPSTVSFQFSAFIKCDITNRDKTVNSIVNAKPDLIIHAAAWTDVDGCEKEPDKAHRINEEGTGHAAASASELDIPLVYISTDFVFDGDKESFYTENDLPNPVNVYGKSKLGGEGKTATLSKYMILRSSWLYGANGKNFVNTILEKIKSEKETKVVDDQIGCPTYTKDLARAIAKLLACEAVSGVNMRVKQLHKLQEIYHISNKGEVSWFDYAKEISKMAKISNVKLIPIKSNQSPRPAKRPRFSVLDNSKFEKAVNFVMRPWQEALREYVDEKR
jgi:dTDP-4-dehydrorhamnose reductase